MLFTMITGISSEILKIKKDEREVVQRQIMLRSKLSDIIPCDLTLGYPLQKKCPLFDVISFNYCVEVASCKKYRTVYSIAT